LIKAPIEVDITNGLLHVDHLGYTLRVLLAAANNVNTKRRTWQIVYKHVTIGSIRISDLKKDNNVPF
jgi:hypothetical protein